MTKPPFEDETPLQEKGMSTRRAILGDAHVNRAEAAKTDFDAPFQALITDAAWGHDRTKDHFSDRERSIVTIALLAALGHKEELAMHIKATENTGASADDIREVFQHVAIYAGVPAANSAIKIAKDVLKDRSE